MSDLSPSEAFAIEERTRRAGYTILGERVRVRAALRLHRPQVEELGALGSVVYYVSLGDHTVKIGTTTRLLHRLSDLQRTRRHLLALEQGGRIEERLVHQRFRGSRVRGEVFLLTPDLLAYITEARERMALWLPECAR